MIFINHNKHTRRREFKERDRDRDERRGSCAARSKCDRRTSVHLFRSCSKELRPSLLRRRNRRLRRRSLLLQSEIEVDGTRGFALLIQ